LGRSLCRRGGLHNPGTDGNRNGFRPATCGCVLGGIQNRFGCHVRRCNLLGLLLVTLLRGLLLSLLLGTLLQGKTRRCELLLGRAILSRRSDGSPPDDPHWRRGNLGNKLILGIGWITQSHETHVAD
jgi:hypothetical protein